MAPRVRTRDRILQTCLRLFNAEGLARVSTHAIAADLGISPGNVHYHFQTKEQMVARLFGRFEQQLQALDGALGSIAAVDDFWLALHLRFETIAQYRFIYRDVAYLASEYPALERRMRELTARNLLAAQVLFERLRAADVVQTGVEQARILALQMVFTTTCWLSFERLLPGREGTDGGPALAAFYALTLIAPYVSPESKAYLDYLKSKYLG